MKPLLDQTHDSKVKSWVESANLDTSDFPIQNLPYGTFRRGAESRVARVGVAVGDYILDLHGMQADGLLAEEAVRIAANACASNSLNPLMSLASAARLALRHKIHAILRADASPSLQQSVSRHLIAQSDADLLLPAQVGDYTDFYASIFHATNVGKLFRPDNPLLPNYKYIPIGYHGRASSLVPQRTSRPPPSGQTRDGDAAPKFGPTKALDYELELGFFVSAGNSLGETIPID